MNKYIFNFTPTGMIPTRDMTPNVPICPQEIVAEVLRVVDHGVNMVHLHARDPESGKPTHRQAVYAEIIGGIRAECPDLVISVSTSGRDWDELEKRAEVLDLDGNAKPDFASLTLSSLNFNHQASVNSPDTIQALAARMKERGIRPELEVFDGGMINYAKYLAKKALIGPPYYFNLILGNIATAQANMLNLGLMVRDLPDLSLWSAGGVGHAQLSMNITALLHGGGVRVGLEDNLWLDEARTRLATNEELVKRVRLIADPLDRQPYSLVEARQVLGAQTR